MHIDAAGVTPVHSSIGEMLKMGAGAEREQHHHPHGQTHSEMQYVCSLTLL